jgi:predicted transcriptional regulator
MKYRSKINIISQILEAANGGNATRSKITYKAFLNYYQLKEYLMLLTEKDLLRYDKDTQTFKTTEKGLRFLDTYNQMDDMIKELHSQQQMWLQREEEV